MMTSDDKMRLRLIKLYGENETEDKWPDYAFCAHAYTEEAVDAFIEEFGIDLFNTSNFEDAFRGAFPSKRDYVEHLLEEELIPDFLVIDWDQTFDNRDEIFCSGFVFAPVF